ncbi:MAG: HNH endonuclease, partial [Nitrosopumilus sp. B06]
NPVYKKIAGEIIKLRKNKKLVDWRFGDPRYGIWRLATSVEKRAIQSYQNKDYSSPIKHTSVIRRTKQTQFRSDLLDSFHHCLFCKFKMDTYLRAAHIVPFSEMQRHEPKNTMNPVNGLLLCTLCDIAFERGAITVDEDYHISPTRELKILSEPDTANACWLSKIDRKLRIKASSKIEPDTRYLKWKLELNNS